MSWLSWNANSAHEWAIAGSIAGGLFMFLWIIRTVLRRQLRDAATTISEVDDFFLLIAQKTKILLLLLPCLYIGARYLDVPRSSGRLLRHGTMLSVIAQGTLWATAVVDFWLRRYRRTRVESDPASVMTVNVFRIGAIAALWIFAGVLTIQNLGFDVTTLIAGLGIGGVAVALATQNILGDLFASLSIVIDKPFILGDAIAVEKQAGTVEHIGLKTTRVRAASGEQLIFANGDLLKSRIHNYSRIRERRSLSRVLVRYGTPVELLDRIPALLRSAVERHPPARFDRAHLITLGDAAYEFELTFFTPADYLEHLDLQQAVLLDVIRALEAEGITLAERVHART